MTNVDKYMVNILDRKEEIKGFNLNISNSWETVVECWKRIILAQLHYQRPMLIGEIRQFTQNSAGGLADKCVQQMVEEGLAYLTDYMPGLGDHYIIDIDKFISRGLINIIPQEDYEDKRYEHLKYVLTLQHGERLYQEGLDNNLDNLQIVEYIQDEVEKLADRRERNSKLRRERAEEAQIKRNLNRTRKKAIKKMDEAGLTGKLLKGEITLEQYEYVLQRISQSI